MNAYRRPVKCLVLLALALLALVALYPPGPTRAQEEPPPPTPLATKAPVYSDAAATLAGESPVTSALQAAFTVYLPLVAGGGAPDLAFDPPALELAPGEEAARWCASTRPLT